MSIIFRIAIFLFTFSALSHASMTSIVNEKTKKLKIKPSQISVLIREIKSGKELVSIKADTKRRPASVMKVLTTYASLMELGLDYGIPTRLYYHGYYEGGIIHGDLIVKGYGDPTLSKRDIKKIVRKMRSFGIRGLTGDIILDRSFFKHKYSISSGFDKNTYSEYNAMPDAIMFNDHLSRITVRHKDGEIVVNKSIPDKSYSIDNRLVASQESCSGSRSWPRVNIKSSGLRPTVVLSGKISIKCSPRTVSKVITNPYKSFYYALRAEMIREKMNFHGSMHLSAIPDGSKYLFEHRSRQLYDIVAKTAKKSNNLYARHLLLLVGAKLAGAPASEEKSRKAVTKLYEGKRLIRKDALYIDNGCGLSRKSIITARGLSNVLHSAYGKYGKKWRRALSIAGVDGTIRRRFAHSVAKGRAWMKTGTLNDAKNISGYVQSKSSGKLYSLVVLYNGREKWKASSLQNQLINWLAR